MISRMLSRLTYANIVATLALFFALGGGAYAALNVTGDDVRDGSLTGRDIRKDSITRKDVRGLTRSDFRRGQILAGADNTQVVQVSGTVGSNGIGSAVAQCPGSMVSAGGGFDAGNAAGELRASVPAGINAWLITMGGGNPGAEFLVFVVCVP